MTCRYSLIETFFVHQLPQQRFCPASTQYPEIHKLHLSALSLAAEQRTTETVYDPKYCKRARYVVAIAEGLICIIAQN